jgi:hypothetical protein
MWVGDPFQAYSHENDFIELLSDSGLKIQFCDLGFSRFWISHSVRSEFPGRSIESCHAVFNNLFFV